MTTLSFDSILVRLKDVSDIKTVMDSVLFRFHTGSIKSGNGQASNDIVQVSFRFHTSSIKSSFTHRRLVH